MKDWIIKLITGLTASILLTLLLTALAQSFHLTFYSRFASVVAGFAVAIGVMYLLKVSTNFRMLILWSILPGISTIIAHNWLFYSADETVEYADLEEASRPESNDLYFTLDSYWYNTSGASDLLVTTTRKRRGRSSTSKRVYTVIPFFTDSISETVQAWLVYNTKAADYDKAETYEDLLRFEDILCFERRTEKLKYYQEAIKKSSYHDQVADNVIYFEPLYREFVPTHTWRKYFTLCYVGSGCIFILIGVIMNQHKRKEEEKEGQEEV
ncbi:MAG: hypothetical protein LIP00_04980 [Parabacteroides sp.]|nr:hypothetical protein [Parabacteroides sp.]